MSETVKQIRERLSQLTDRSDPYVQSLATDSRKGVQQALTQFYRRLERQAAAQAAFRQRFRYEEKLWRQGCRYVAGMDEVGRGPLAGPVVTCAVILRPDFDLVGVTDSKQLTRHEREQLYLQIVNEAVEVSIAVNDREAIDRLNIYAATQDAMIRAVNNLHHRPDHLIVDAVPLKIAIPQTTLIKGDQKSISVAAASIVAKEYRDHLMRDYDRVYPGYGLAENMGYGTKEHLAGLAAHGATPIHRRSFRPVQDYLN
ncbi:MAG: ribonuclease HII [Limosilactobacillus sp.]|uniref:ribonuclease HII n=1 Tax=Limosilactobacillus sp. TaxID=2773925 RepID=UPI002A750BC7|nr:ribonuclease HII [Limosilactobacillus sp.]MDD7693154.1 ribonuclease HII [Lactobacillaceae bacterium]MDY2802764.1 ribonuclease HII [Limosilactobacillus sp.]